MRQMNSNTCKIHCVGCSAFYVSLSHMTCEVMIACNSYILCSSHSASQKRDPHFYFKFQFLKICLVPLSPRPSPVEEPPIRTSLFHSEAIPLHHAPSISFLLHKGGPPNEVVAHLALERADFLPRGARPIFALKETDSVPRGAHSIFASQRADSLPRDDLSIFTLKELTPFLEVLVLYSLSRGPHFTFVLEGDDCLTRGVHFTFCL